LISADEAITTLRDLASPVAAFVRERCAIGPNETVPVDELYAAFKVWADSKGHLKSPKQVFSRDLRAAVPAIRVGQPGTTHRVRVYMGISLRDSDDNTEDKEPS
jgi:putative DNA primase/helicase